MLQALIGPISNLVGGYMKNKAEEKQAKHQAKINVIQNDANWEQTMAVSSWTLESKSVHHKKNQTHPKWRCLCRKAALPDLSRTGNNSNPTLMPSLANLRLNTRNVNTVETTGRLKTLVETMNVPVQSPLYRVSLSPGSGLYPLRP